MKGVFRKLARAQVRLQAEMRGHGEGKYARGLSSEGWAGGYAQALRDVDALLRGNPVSYHSEGYWTDEETHLDRMTKK